MEEQESILLHHTTFEYPNRSKHWPSAEHLWNVGLFEIPPMILQSRPCFWIYHPSWSWKNIPIQLDLKFIGYMFV